MKVLLALAFLLWFGADARYTPEQDVRYPPEHVERHYRPEFSLHGPPFIVGKTHHYELTINMTAGVPGMSSQVAKSLIHVDVSIWPKSENEYVLKAENVRVSESGISVDSGEAPLPLRRLPELEKDLSQPIRFVYEDGKVKAYTLGHSESLPSKSIKRAILRHLQMKLDHSAQRPQEEYSENYPLIYTTTERDEAGPYEATYTVNVSPYPEYPYDDKVYNVTRVHDYEQYGYPAYYEHHNYAEEGSPAAYRVENEHHYGAGYKTHQTLLRASKVVHHNLRHLHDKMVLENIQVHEKSVAAIYNQDLVVSIESYYALREVSDRRIEEPPRQQAQYHELNTAPTEEELRREKQTGTEEVTEEYQFIYGIFDSVRSSELVGIADRILEKISGSVVVAEIEAPRVQEVTEDVAHLQDVFSLLKKTHLDNVYRKIVDVRNLRRAPEKEKVKRQFFLDVLPLAGTDDSVEYIKYLIQEKKVSIFEAKELLESIPSNLIKATEKNVHDLLALTELPHIRQHHVLHSAVYLTVSNVIREAYVVPQVYQYTEEEDSYDEASQQEQEYKHHDSHSRYSRHFYKENKYQSERYPESREKHYGQWDESPRRYEATLQKYIQEVRSKLRSARKIQEKIVYIEALAQLGHKYSLKVLKPYVYGNAADTEEYAPGDVDFLKTVALYSLHHIVKYYPEETQEIVAPVYFNKTEEPRVRIAAFSVLIHSLPSLGLLQRVAVESYDEPSNEVGSYVYSALLTHGNSTLPSQRLTADRIKHIISQVKNYDIGKQYSKTVIKTFFDELRNYGIEKKLAVVHSNESFIPSSFYVSLKYGIQALKDVIYQAKFNIQGLTVEDLLKVIDSEVLGLRPPRDIPQGAEKDIFKGLHLLPRLPKELRMTVYKKIFYTSHYHYIDAESIGSYILPLLDYLRDYLSFERGSVSGHLVKTYIPSSYHALTYSSLGFPVDFRMKHPLVISLKVESRRPHRASGFAYYIRPSVYYGAYHKHSILNTGVRRAYGVYQETKYTATFPVEVSLDTDDESNTLEVIFKLPEVPKRVYNFQSEAGTYENQLKLRYALSGEENRETIKSIPALFQRENLVTALGLPALHISTYTEDIHDYPTEVPEDLDDVIETFLEAMRDPGFRRREINATIVSRPSSPVDQVKFTFSYNKTYDAPSESQSSGGQSNTEHALPVQDPRSRRTKYQTVAQGHSGEDEFTVVSKIFPQSQTSRDEYEEISAEQARKVHEAFSEVLSNVAYEFGFRVETKPSVHVAEVKVEYNHTFDKTLHNVHAEFEAYSAETRTPHKIYFAHVTKYGYGPHEFHYDPRAYVGQYASFFHAVSFEHRKPYEQSDVIAKGAFYRVHPEQHFTHDEFVEKPDHEAFTPDTQDECLKDVQEGKSLSPACIAAVEEDSRLNKFYVKVAARQDLPPVVQNLTNKLEDAFKYYYYDSAEVNSVQVNNAPRTLEMVVNYIDKLTDEPVLDVYMKKPRENVIYHKIDSEYYKPLSSVYSLHESHKLRSSNYTYPPSCALMEKYVKTYDMKVFPLPHDGCSYVLSTHCTDRKKFAVLAKQVSSSEYYKEVAIYVADQKVVLKPETSTAGAYNIVYNDRHIEVKTPVLLDERNLLYVYPVNVHDERVKHVLVVRAEKAGIKVEYDGKIVKVEVSPIYKGELCGLCSEYDGEYTREYRGPNQCLYDDSEDFAHSSVIDADTCGVKIEPKYPVLCPRGERRTQYSRRANSPYGSYIRSRYPDEEEYEQKYRYPYNEEDDEQKSRYPYNEEDEQKYRYPYDYQKDKESRYRRSYDNEDFSETSRYPYGDEDEYRKSRNTYDNEDEYYQSRYPFDNEYYKKSHYPYGDASYKKSRYPYGDDDVSYKKSRYPYGEEGESYKKSHYPYGDDDDDSYRKSRYPYGDEDEYYKKSRYPYGDEDEYYKKSHYPYRDEDEYYKKSRYPYGDDEDDSYRKSRYPYGDQDEYYKKSSYPYGDEDEYDKKSRYPYGDKDESYKKTRYPFDDEDESYTKSRYPYGDEDEYKKSRYPFGDKDEYKKSHYPYGDENEYKKSRYPFGGENEYKKSHYQYGDEDEYKKSRYPYGDEDETYKKSRYPFDNQYESYKKSHYPYGENSRRQGYSYDEDYESSKKHSYPYGDQDESSVNYRYPYGNKDESYRKSYHPYDEQDESFRKNRYGNDDEEESYKKSGYPYDEQEESYKRSRYPYDDKEEYGRKFTYPHDDQDDSYRKSRKYYDDDSYRNTRYPYSEESRRYGFPDDEEEETRYPYAGKYESYKRSYYPYEDQHQSYSYSKYPYGDDSYKASYSDEEQSYGESRYHKTDDNEDEFYGRSGYPFKTEEESYKKSFYPYADKDDEESASYGRGFGARSQPKERTVYVQRRGYVCFSTQPVPVCEKGYRPTEQYQKSVAYHCLPTYDVTAIHLIQESKVRVLRELYSKKVDYTETYPAAKYCTVY